MIFIWLNNKYNIPWLLKKMNNDIVFLYTINNINAFGKKNF